MALTVFTSTQPNARDRRGLDALTQVAILGVLWSSYAAVRQITGDTRDVAIDNAARLLDLEAAVGLDIESIAQSAVTWERAFVAANAYYLVHFPLTFAVVVATFWRHRTTVYPLLRDSLIGSTAVALLLHLVIPMAPPRMLPGFIDAGARFGPDPYAVAGSESANQFAALPSLHVAWAVLAGYTVWRLSDTRIVRSVAAAHPVITAVVVVITGHHFVVDVAIGAGLAIGFVALARSVGSIRSANAGAQSRSAERRSRIETMPTSSPPSSATSTCRT